MAYLRREIKKDKIYLSICENYRNDEGKVARRVLHNLGNLDTLGEAALQRIATQMLAIIKKDIPIFETKELVRVNYGFSHVLYHCLTQYDLVNYFNRLSKKHKLSYPLLSPILLMLCDRLNDPLSKLGSYKVQQEYYGIKDIALHQIYRSLDYLSANNEVIQSHIYQHNRDLFNYELDVVFFDVTTFYFDSAVVKENELRQLGFGKDGKIGKTQLVFSLLIDKNKMPIGFEIFNGKQFEGHTFETAVKKLRTKYNIGKVIVVADSGMMNKKNIDIFSKGGDAEQYEYIVGDRLKNLAHSTKNYLINKENYTTTITADKDNPIKICVVKQDDKTIIGTWSANRAAKDKYEREQKVKKAEVLLKNPAQLKKKPTNYYLKTTDKINYVLDKQRIVEDEKYDGYKAIATNANSISTEQVLEQYSYLYQIEHSFRTFKSFLETRPMFHWTDDRIKGHLVMCYISFVLLRYLQQKTELSEQQLRKTLNKMQLSKIQNNKEVFWLRSAYNEDVLLINQKLQLKSIPDTISLTNIKNLIPSFL
jgi:transposase